MPSCSSRADAPPARHPRLPIRQPHLLALDQLPLHQRDPFARQLVAQAMAGPFTLLSADGAIRAYGCSLQDARS